jgi:hypothetical protein
MVNLGGRPRYVPTRVPLGSPPPRPQMGKLTNAQYSQYLRALDNKMARHNGRLLAEFNHMNNVALMAGAQEILKRSAFEAANGFTRDLLGASALFAEALDEATRGGQGSARLMQMYEAVGRKAQSATVDAYKRSKYIKLGMSYRYGDPGKYRRFSNNALLNALQSPTFYRVGPDGLSFINAPMLDRAAKQWYRLNFGAGSKANKGASPQMPEIVMFGQRIGRGPDLSKFRPSRPFGMPAGMWSDDLKEKTSSGIKQVKNGRAFYPRFLMQTKDGFWGKAQRDEKGKVVPVKGAISAKRAEFPVGITKGIAAARFLDVGVASINRNLPMALESLMFEWVEQAAGKARKRSLVTGVSESKNLAPGGPMFNPMKQAEMDSRRVYKQMEKFMEQQSQRRRANYDRFGRAARSFSAGRRR